VRIVVLAPLLFAGCIVKIVDGSTTRTMAPATMATTDIGASCSTGMALGPVLSALGEVGRRPYKAMTFTSLAAGMCGDVAAWGAELDRLRAVQGTDASGSRDHLIRERRIHAATATRYYDAWLMLDLAFPNEDLGEDCPRLSVRKNEDLLLLLGLTSGALAMVHDRAAEGIVGVPTDLPRKVERAAACLDDDKFWGVPRALQASVWAAVPGAAPPGVDPWEVLAEAAATGESASVRLGRALQVQALSTAGHRDAVRDAIRSHATSVDATPSDPAWALLDRFATELILHESDKIWMSAVGHRTPLGGLGTFPDDPAADSELDPMLDGILEAVMGSDITQAPVAPAAEPSEVNP
jgi:hypothetical protein